MQREWTRHQNAISICTTVRSCMRIMWERMYCRCAESLSTPMYLYTRTRIGYFDLQIAIHTWINGVPLHHCVHVANVHKYTHVVGELTPPYGALYAITFMRMSRIWWRYVRAGRKRRERTQGQGSKAPSVELLSAKGLWHLWGYIRGDNDDDVIMDG